MTDEQYQSLTDTLSVLRDNQRIINENVGALTKQVSALQREMDASIRNDHVAENYFQAIQQTLKQLLSK